MFIIIDSINQVLLEDGSWESKGNAKKPFRLFPEWSSAQEALEHIDCQGGHPPAKASSLYREYADSQSMERKHRKRERRMIRKASVVPLKEARVLRGVGESVFDQVFTEFRVLHLVVSEYQQVIGVIGETDDPQTPFYSYVGDEYHYVFGEEECYSTLATLDVATEATNWQDEGF
ncbi:hypothetical protein [Rosistilla oblonga]|uniref:hypothetical protein n=1 Tax=Rosistilla oblonga TaxID=2527990 RepID=UPI003A9822F0